jgi:hypothetical protein
MGINTTSRSEFPFGRSQAALNGENAMLDEDRFGQLDALLNQTGMYTKFLSEQMQQMTEEMEGEPAVGSKRKAGRQGGNSRKKGSAANSAAVSKVCTLLSRHSSCQATSACMLHLVV